MMQEIIDTLLNGVKLFSIALINEVQRVILAGANIFINAWDSLEAPKYHSKQTNAFLHTIHKKEYHKPDPHKAKISQRRLNIYQRRYEASHRGPTNDSAKWAAYCSHYIINSEGQAIPLTGFTFDARMDYKNMVIDTAEVATFNRELTRLRNFSIEMYGTWR